MIYTFAILTAIIAYLIGSINTSIILSKALYGDDIRNSGSGNAGATNMLRTHGKGIAVATLLCDVLKGVLAVLLAMGIDSLITAHMDSTALSANEQIYLWDNFKYIAGIFVVLGHDFPIYFGLRGGKGVATSLGVAAILDWKVALIIAVIAISIMIVTKYVSLGSICAGALYPFVLFTYLLITDSATLDTKIAYIGMSFLLGALLIVKHHSNIRKLLKGTENKLFAKKDSASAESQSGEEDAELDKEDE